MGEAFLLNAQILGAERVKRKPVPPPAPEPVQTWPLIGETETGDILVQAGSEPLTVTLESAPYQGSYVLDPAALAAAPVNLVAPAIAGTAAVGQILTAVPGLWSHDGTGVTPTLAWQWLRDGTSIAGATDTVYTTTAADAGRAISLRETAQDAHGAAQAVSAALAIPAPIAAGPLLVQGGRAKAVGTTASRVFAGVDLGAPAPTRDIVVLAAAIGAAGAAITGVTVAGVAATRLAQATSGGSGLVCAGAYLARVPAGATGDVELTTAASTAAQHVAVFRGEALQLADSATASVASAGLVAMAIAAGRANGKVLAFAANNNGTAFDWTGAAEIYDEDIQSGRFVSAALGDADGSGRANATASRASGTGQMAGLMVAF